MNNVVSAKINEWQRMRAELKALERAEHPDIIDHHGRTWSWKSRDLYVHDSMAWPKSVIEDGRHGLPSPELADNPNYRLCDICLNKGQAS